MNGYETHELTKLLSADPYPGRGIVLGTSEDGKRSVVAYFIMGRSENSRNRISLYVRMTDRETGRYEEKLINGHE